MKIPIFLNFDYTNVIGYAVFKDDFAIREGDEFAYITEEKEDGTIVCLRALSLVSAPTQARRQEKE